MGIIQRVFIYLFFPIYFFLNNTHFKNYLVVVLLCNLTSLSVLKTYSLDILLAYFFLCTQYFLKSYPISKINTLEISKGLNNYLSFFIMKI